MSQTDGHAARRTKWLVAAACALPLLAPAGARAGVLVPLLDDQPVDRVKQAVPLGPSGATLALNATSTEPGRKVGANSYLIRQGIYLVGGDGGDFRLAWAAEQGDDISSLTATSDGGRLAWSTMFGTYTMDVATRRVHPVPSSGSNGQPSAFVAGPHQLYALSDGGSIRLLTAGGRLRGLVRAGARGMRTHPAVVVLSPSGANAGTCAAGTRSGVRLGLLDRAGQRVRQWRAGAGLKSTLGDTPSCAVSDDGSTVATLASRGGRAVVLARRHDRMARVAAPRGLVHVASLSPDGRYALLGGGPEHEESFGLQRLVELDGPIAVVDLDTGHVARLSHPSRFSKRTRNVGRFIYGNRSVWSPDDRHVAFAPASGGVVVLDTHTARASFIRTPRAPVGQAFDGKLTDPVAFSADGSQVVFTVADRSEDVTTQHPFMAGIDGSSPPRYLFSRSMRSFSRTVTSADGSRTWVLPSYTCHTTYPQSLLELTSGSLWDGPFTATPDPYA